MELFPRDVASEQHTLSWVRTDWYIGTWRVQRMASFSARYRHAVISNGFEKLLKFQFWPNTCLTKIVPRDHDLKCTRWNFSLFFSFNIFFLLFLHIFSPYISQVLTCLCGHVLVRRRRRRLRRCSFCSDTESIAVQWVTLSTHRHDQCNLHIYVEALWDTLSYF